MKRQEEGGNKRVWFGGLGGSRTGSRQQAREVVLEEFLTVMETVEVQDRRAQ